MNLPQLSPEQALANLEALYHAGRYPNSPPTDVLLGLRSLEVLRACVAGRLAEQKQGPEAQGTKESTEVLKVKKPAKESEGQRQKKTSQGKRIDRS